uniref:Uncharacterized protein n=1 Tax=viral metagenome TaxID=1070528 RepID=A0A6C0BZ54_9ZZZZ
MGHYLIHTVEIFIQNESFYENETFMKLSKQVKGNLVI